MPPFTLVPRFAAGLVALSLALPAAPEIIRPKVVIVAMFEPGQDTGDAPGEFQYWVEREKLELYQRRYAEYVRTAKSLQALMGS